MALEVLNAQDERRSSELSQHSSDSSSGSIVAQVVDTEVFWSSTEQEEVVRKATNVAYERLVKPEDKRKRDKIARLFTTKPGKPKTTA
ncbi:hypothetical protein L914_13205 [Phytophthora nicotianae]|nr:hypothetical protein L916_13296 [Phytophthora nicotianae]ETM40978.1 hypothetical protein L914_13205 [Phytophthora nicotianae]